MTSISGTMDLKTTVCENTGFIASDSSPTKSTENQGSELVDENKNGVIDLPDSLGKEVPSARMVVTDISSKEPEAQLFIFGENHLSKPEDATLELIRRSKSEGKDVVLFLEYVVDSTDLAGRLNLGEISREAFTAELKANVIERLNGGKPSSDISGRLDALITKHINFIASAAEAGAKIVSVDVSQSASAEVDAVLIAGLSGIPGVNIPKGTIDPNLVVIAGVGANHANNASPARFGAVSESIFGDETVFTGAFVPPGDPAFNSAGFQYSNFDGVYLTAP